MWWKQWPFLFRNIALSNDVWGAYTKQFHWEKSNYTIRLNIPNPRTRSILRLEASSIDETEIKRGKQQERKTEFVLVWLKSWSKPRNDSRTQCGKWTNFYICSVHLMHTISLTKLPNGISFNGKFTIYWYHRRRRTFCISRYRTNAGEDRMH